MVADSAIPGGSGGGPGGGAGGSASTHSAIRFRIASFGRRPMPPSMLSTMCATLVVPVRTTVTAGWLRTYLVKNCDHVFASNSAAHSGTGLLATRVNRLVPPVQLRPEALLNGKNTITPIFRS